MEEQDVGLHHYFDIARRRKWYVLAPFVLLFAASVLVALLLPPTYRSSATILIEAPDIPRELVTSTITGFADQRLQVINQRVMATDNLLDIVRKYDLYAEQRQRSPISKVIEDMRENIGLELISAEVRDPQSRQTGEATIAFKVYFEHRQPRIAQLVSNELTSLYLGENLRDRQEKASETAVFLRSETRRLESTIADLEKQMAELKQKHADSLPEQREYNLQMIARAEQEQRDLDRQAQSLHERKIYLESQLAQLSPYGSYGVGGNQVLSPHDQLKAMRTQLASISGRYGPDHPDVIGLKREIEALERETGTGQSTAALRQQLRQTETELAAATQKYTDQHPTVVRLQREARSVRGSIERAQRQPERSGGGGPPDNPAYIQLRAQAETADFDLKSIASQKEVIREQIETFAKRLEATPQVEQQYQHIARALESATAEYQALRAKQVAADLGQTLETERKSERFSLIEPPVLPTEPIKPNRLAIILIGFVLSLGSGVGLAVLTESMDNSVHSARDIAMMTGVAPLTIVPYIRTRGEAVRTWRLRAAIGMAAVLLVIGVVALVHTQILPLEVVWAALERRAGMVLFSTGI